MDRNWDHSVRRRQYQQIPLLYIHEGEESYLEILQTEYSAKTNEIWWLGGTTLVLCWPSLGLSLLRMHFWEWVSHSTAAATEQHKGKTHKLNWCFGTFNVDQCGWNFLDLVPIRLGLIQVAVPLANTRWDPLASPMPSTRRHPSHASHFIASFLFSHAKASNHTPRASNKKKAYQQTVSVNPSTSQWQKS